MTNKAFYEAVISANINEEVTEKAKALLDSTTKKNSKRAEEQSANRLANIELAKQIATTMQANHTYGASEIVAFMQKSMGAGLMPTTPINTAKVTAVCKVAVEEGIMTATDGYKVGGKGRAVKGYQVSEEFLASLEDNGEDSEEDSEDNGED